MGIHQEACIDAVPFTFDADAVDMQDNISLISTSINSAVNTHGSISYALLIGKCPQLIDVLETVCEVLLC